jgi:serine/threonine protein phosphatase PrpC
MQAYFSKAGTVQMFAVFDGHANAKGTEVNKIAKQLKAIIEDMNHKLYGKLCPAAELLAFDKIVTPTEQDKKKLEEAITKSFMSVNDELKKEFGRGGSGSCATITFITPSHIIVANVGDSRTCIAFKDGTVWVTKDHKPSNPEEQKRIKAAGGFVEYGRVGGRLAVARSFGDYFAKGVVPLPDVTIFERSPKDPNKKPELIVQACDGVWESVDLMKGGVTQYVTDIQQRVNKGEKIIAGMCTDLAKKAAKKSNDDITVLLVDVR